ncbi:MAG: hypothetical protein MR029_09885 [Clostridium sp.]|nr:hypothetical protein [Clostridium sp.]
MADRTIRKFVYKVRRKLRRQKVFGALFSSLFAGLLVAVVISGLSLCIPLYYAGMIELVSIGISVCVGVICGIYRTPSLQQAALAADALGYQEKISTALYLQGKDDMFSRLQRKDALDAVRQIEIRKAFPLKVLKRKIGGLVLIAVVFAVSCMVDSPVRETAKQQHELRREVKEEIAKVNKVQKKIKDVSSKEAKQLDKQLEQIKEELTKVDSQESLQKTKERSVKKLQQTAQGLKDSTLRNRLQAMTEQAQKEQEEQKRNMAEDAAKAFEQAKDGSKKEKDAAYEKVKKYAQANGNHNLEKKIQDYKDSGYSDADYVRAGAALDEAVENTNNESEYASNNGSSDSQKNNGQAAQSKEKSTSQGTPSGNQQTGQQTGTQGQTKQNNVAGTTGAQNANGNNGSGNNSGSTGGSGQSGTGAGWNRGNNAGQERDAKTAENVTIPDGESGQDENLTGKANSKGSSQKTTSDQANTWSGNKVDYSQVSGSYKKKAYKQIDGASYPAELKKQIRNYFDGLN